LGLITLCISTSYAQLIQKTFGHPYNNTCNALIVTNDGGYALIGAYDVDRLFTGEMNLLKTDSAGELMWSFTYGERKDRRAKKKDGSGNGGYDLIQTRDSGYLLIGETHGFGAGIADVYVVRVNVNGDTLWSYAYGGAREDYGYAVIEGFDDNFLVAGYTESYGAGIRDGYLLMLDEAGDTLWTRTVGSSSVDGLFDVIRTKDSCYLALGYTLESGNADILLIKLDRNGNTIWLNTYGGQKNDFGYAMIESADTSLISAGNTESFGQGFQDAYVLRINANGVVEWSKTYGGVDYESVNSIDIDEKGFVLVGQTKSFGAGWEDIYALRINANGDTLWTRTYGDINRDIGKTVKNNKNGYVICANTLSLGFGNVEIYMIQIDARGTTSCYEHGTKTVINPANTVVDSLNMQVKHGATITKTPTIIGKTILGNKSPCTDTTSGFIETHDRGLRFSVSPNPCQSSMRVTLGKPCHGVTIEISNVFGETVIQESLFHSGVDYLVQMGHLMSGTYVVKVQSEHQHGVMRIVKI
jgi:hypothetical protein